MAFSLRYWLSHQNSLVDNIDEFEHQMLIELSKLFKVSDDVDMPSSPQNATFEDLVSRLKNEFTSLEPTIGRLRTLVSTICNPSSSMKNGKMTLIRGYLKAILDLPRTYVSTVIDQRILTLYSSAYEKLQNDEMTASFFEDQEQCSICDAVIRFESLTVSYCSEGHQFGKKLY